MKLKWFLITRAVWWTLAGIALWGWWKTTITVFVCLILMRIDLQDDLKKSRRRREKELLRREFQKTREVEKWLK